METKRIRVEYRQSCTQVHCQPALVRANPITGEQREIVLRRLGAIDNSSFARMETICTRCGEEIDPWGFCYCIPARS